MKLVWLIKICLNIAYNKFHIDKHLSDAFHIQNNLKEGYATSMNIAFKLCFRIHHQEGPRKKEGLELKRIYHVNLFVYADYVNLLSKNLNVIKKTTKLNTASKVGQSESAGSSSHQFLEDTV
jgi:hypothetical protein